MTGGHGAAGSSPVTPTITSVLIGFKKFYENTRFLLPYMFHTATQALVSKLTSTPCLVWTLTLFSGIKSISGISRVPMQV